mgnify:CR=1 FL=1
MMGTFAEYSNASILRIEYADDLILISSGKKEEELERRVNEKLEKIREEIGKMNRKLAM